ncbi:MAG: serine/threonine-protein kinase [Rhodospirillaceae bacterium]
MNGKTSAPLTAASGAVAGSLDEIALCAEFEDYYGPASRQAIGHLLRSYLEPQGLTPTELLHNCKAVKALTAQPSTLDAAITGAATLQAKIPGNTLKERREALSAAVDLIRSRAAKAEKTLAELAAKGPPFALLLRDKGMQPGESAEADYLLVAAVCRDLVGIRGWSKKLSFLVSLASDDASGRVAALLDSGIADLLGIPSLISELLGVTPLLGVAIRRTLDLALTEMPRPADASNQCEYALNDLLRAGFLPQARAVLLDRARRQLRTGQPLGSGRREEDITAFHGTLFTVVTPAGVAGGPGMAEALVTRYARRLEQGGASALRLAMQGVVETLPNLFSRLQFLAAIAASEQGVKVMNELVMSVETLGNNTLLLESSVFKPFDPKGLREGLDHAIAAFERTGYPREVKDRLRDRIGGLIDDFVTRGSFLELMDKAELDVTRRARCLNTVIAAGLVTEYGGGLLIEQHINRLGVAKGTEQLPATALLTAAGVTKPVAAVPRRDTHLIARFGRHRCPNCFESKSGNGMCMVCGHDESEAPRPGVHLQPGSILQERYVVGRLIGQGGFGATYIGWDERLEVKIAVKEYFPVSLAGRSPGTGALMPYTDDMSLTFRDGVEKFLDEARILAQLRDVNEIVRVHDQFEANATAYMVMELLIGRTLQRHLLEEGGTIDYRRALSLILPIAKAVHDVHQMGLVHRDISPDNIFLLNGGGAKLLDFGAARHCVGEATNSLTVILKRGYAPPEQYATEGHQGSWTDVYALCATFYCAITGRPPPDATARLGNDEVLPRPSALGVVIPAAVEDVLLSGLALRWQDRPKDTKMLLQAFSKALV